MEKIGDAAGFRRRDVWDFPKDRIHLHAVYYLNMETAYNVPSLLYRIGGIGTFEVITSAVSASRKFSLSP